jgi:DNA primase
MKNYIPDDVIEEIRLSNDIVDVVSDYVKLEKKGKYLFGLCPFHNEKTPSFSVTPAMQIFNCFGCNKGGNVVHFIMNIENLNFIEAIELLADRAGIKLPDKKDERYKKDNELRNQIFEINRIAAIYFYKNIISTAGSNAREYLKNRNILRASIKKFGLGYSTVSEGGLYGYLLDKGFDEGLIIKSGLVAKGKSGDFYDRFRKRLMFPIFDVQGRVLGFGGRVLGSSIPKYINSSETFIYKKGRNLYGLNFAKMAREKRIIIVEGYMDVIALHQSGIINSVASLGTALTERQGQLLKKYAEEIIISFDEDQAGKAATIRSLDLLAKMGCIVKVLSIPEGKDPHEFVTKNGPVEFKKLIENALGLIEYKIREQEKQINTTDTEGKIEFIKKVAQILSKSNSTLEIELYGKKISKEYGISEGTLRAEILKYLPQKNSYRNIKTYKTKKNIVNLELKNIKTRNESSQVSGQAELLFFAILCIDNSLFRLIKDKISIDNFENKEIATWVFEKLDNGLKISSGEILNLMDAKLAGMFANTIKNQCNFEDNTKAFIDIVSRIRVIGLKKREKEILEVLNNIKDIGNEKEQDLQEELRLLVKELKNAKIYQRKEG